MYTYENTTQGIGGQVTNTAQGKISDVFDMTSQPECNFSVIMSKWCFK